MSVLTFSENNEKVLVPFENGSPLANFNKPLEQGLKWTYSIGKLGTKDLVILGLGGGFHITALLDMDPSLRITVVEFRSSLVSRFRNQYSEYADRMTICELQDIQDIFNISCFSMDSVVNPLVISFQESWGDHFEKFAIIFSYLTGRSEESLMFHLKEHGITVKARMNVDFFDKHNQTNAAIVKFEEAI